MIFNLNNLQVGRRTTICKVDPVGSITALMGSRGAIQLFFRYTFNNNSHSIKIGLYDKFAPPRSVQPTPRGFSLAAAKLTATTMAVAHQASLSAGGGGLAEELQQKKAARTVAQQAAASLKTYTVAKLCEMYLATLTNKNTVCNVRGVFKHIPTKILKLPAKSVDTETWIDVMRLVASKQPRTANKLRSYMMAAYNLARRAKADMSLPLEFKAFKIVSNPFTDTLPNHYEGGVDKNPLKTSEMQEYWRYIKDLKGVEGATLRIHLLTGGLRILQLLRLKKDDVDWESNIFTLLDSKGKRKQAARYSTPILPVLRKDFELLINQSPTEYVFSLPKMLKEIENSTLRKWAHRAIEGSTIKGFNLKRIRSGVETLLAAQNISDDIRGRLQSHGVSGIQNKHYNAHDYVKEKLHALSILQQVVTATPATVIKMPGVA